MTSFVLTKVILISIAFSNPQASCNPSLTTFTDSEVFTLTNNSNNNKWLESIQHGDKNLFLKFW